MAKEEKEKEKEKVVKPGKGKAARIILKLARKGLVSMRRRVWEACKDTRTLDNTCSFINLPPPSSSSSASSSREKEDACIIEPGFSNEGRSTVEYLSSSLLHGGKMLHNNSNSNGNDGNKSNNDDNGNDEEVVAGLLRELGVVVQYSEDPQKDFLQSMQEMAEMHGLQSYPEYLEALLHAYLHLNSPRHYGSIVGAFLHLVTNPGFAVPSLPPSYPTDEKFQV